MKLRGVGVGVAVGAGVAVGVGVGDGGGLGWCADADCGRARMRSRGPAAARTASNVFITSLPMSAHERDGTIWAASWVYEPIPREVTRGWVRLSRRDVLLLIFGCRTKPRRTRRRTKGWGAALDRGALRTRSGQGGNGSTRPADGSRFAMVSPGPPFRLTVLGPGQLLRASSWPSWLRALPDSNQTNTASLQESRTPRGCGCGPSTSWPRHMSSDQLKTPDRQSASPTATSSTVSGSATPSPLLRASRAAVTWALSTAAAVRSRRSMPCPSRRSDIVAGLCSR